MWIVSQILHDKFCFIIPVYGRSRPRLWYPPTSGSGSKESPAKPVKKISSRIIWTRIQDSRVQIGSNFSSISVFDEFCFCQSIKKLRHLVNGEVLRVTMLLCYQYKLHTDPFLFLSPVVKVFLRLLPPCLKWIKIQFRFTSRRSKQWSPQTAQWGLRTGLRMKWLPLNLCRQKWS